MDEEIKFDKYRTRGAGYHWDQISKSITKRNIFVLARYNIVLNQITDFKNKQILEVGCGDGVLTYLCSQKGSSTIGIDVSGDAIKFAREKTKNIKNIEFIRASAYHLPFKHNFFDYVISSDVIEHLKEPQRMLAEIKRVYKGNNKVIITTPLRFTDEPLDKMHVQEFFESDFRRLLNVHFSEIQIIKSHPIIYMELQNRHILFKLIFNLANILFKFNPFEKSRGWRYYSILTAIIEDVSREKNNKSKGM